MFAEGQLPVCRPAVDKDGEPYVRVVGYGLVGESLSKFRSLDMEERAMYIAALVVQTDV